MNWVLAFLLAVLAFSALAFLLKAPRKGWEAIGAALLLGLAGYGLQASSGLPGAPKPPQQAISGDDSAAMVKARQSLGGQASLPGNDLVLIGDALARNGQYADAASILLGAVEKDPKNADAWLAMANALVSHADGMLTPAALFAYQHAAQAGPDNPGSPFFLGLALAQSGRLAEGRALWANLLERSPPDAPWRADLEMRLGRLDALIAAQEQALQEK